MATRVRTKVFIFAVGGRSPVCGVECLNACGGAIKNEKGPVLSGSWLPFYTVRIVATFDHPKSLLDRSPDLSWPGQDEPHEKIETESPVAPVTYCI